MTRLDNIGKKKESEREGLTIWEDKRVSEKFLIKLGKEEKVPGITCELLTNGVGRIDKNWDELETEREETILLYSLEKFEQIKGVEVVYVEKDGFTINASIFKFCENKKCKNLCKKKSARLTE